MKIVMLCEFYNERLEYQENLLVKYYRKHGHDVTVITSTFESVFDYYNDKHDNQGPPLTYLDQGATIIRLRYRYNILNRLRAYTRIDGILDHAKPDLIYVHDVMPNFPEAIAYVRRHPETRMIMDYHADYSNSGRNALSLKLLHGVARKWFLNRARPYLSRIFPVVPAGAVFLHEVYGVPHSEMEVLPLGADIDLITAVMESGAARQVRDQLGIGVTDKVVFTGGKLAPAKKTELLLEAVTHIGDMPIHVIVAGEAAASDLEYGRALRQRAAGNPRIHFVGWLGREDIYKHLVAADMAVFPASQSILWQQAIAAGLPLIAGNIGHQDISYLNLYDNIIVLKNAEIRADRLGLEIAAVLRDNARRQQMSIGARRVAAEQLDWNRLIERTLQFNLTAGAGR